MLSSLSEIESFLNSPKGEKSIRDFGEKMKRNLEHEIRWVEKFRKKFGENPDLIITQLIEKYYSEKYIQKENKLGFQPREDLLWLVWNYARKHCEPCQDKKYFNTFTGEAFYIGSYVIQIMYGQGAILRIDQNPEKISI